jgi:hypothetical protein
MIVKMLMLHGSKSGRSPDSILSAVYASEAFADDR